MFLIGRLIGYSRCSEFNDFPTTLFFDDRAAFNSGNYRLAAQPRKVAPLRQPLKGHSYGFRIKYARTQDFGCARSFANVGRRKREIPFDTVIKNNLDGGTAT